MIVADFRRSTSALGVSVGCCDYQGSERLCVLQVMPVGNLR
jgi:hypothetical protein